MKTIRDYVEKPRTKRARLYNVRLNALRIKQHKKHEKKVMKLLAMNNITTLREAKREKQQIAKNIVALHRLPFMQEVVIGRTYFFRIMRGSGFTLFELDSESFKKPLSEFKNLLKHCTFFSRVSTEYVAVGGLSVVNIYKISKGKKELIESIHRSSLIKYSSLLRYYSEQNSKFGIFQNAPPLPDMHIDSDNEKMVYFENYQAK